jgi:CheY-like chemotaxis protein
MLFQRKETPTRLKLSAPVIQRVEAGETGGRPKKILIVDDDPVILKTLSKTLQSRGYLVVTATDGGEAIGQVREERPDMLLVDVCLAADMTGCGALGWDGFQIARWVRNLNCNAPAMMISGTDKPEYRQQASAVGAQGFFTKPINNDMLVAAIASTLSNKRTGGLAVN